MLLDRATGGGHGFALSVANAADVARVCRAVDGLPLALELAAGRLRAFSVAQIAERLDRQLELLAGLSDATRHGSLRAAIDWSHDLLTERERLVFARLSVFLGGFTLAAAEAVIADDQLSAGAVMGTLGALVERSLVVVEHRDDPPGEVRYRMLEAIREYATQRLDAASEVRDRHARYFCDLAETANGQRRGADRARWLRWLEEEHGNLRAAMAGAPPALALRFACALIWFWRRFATREALEWLRGVIPAAHDAPAELRQRALIGAGSLALRVSIDEARDFVQRAAALAHELADRPREVEALSFMASTEVYVANAEAVARYGDRAVELARTEGDPYLLARTLMARGLTRAHVGGAASTRDDLVEALTLFQALGDELGMHEVRMARAEADMVSGDVGAIRVSLASIDVAAMTDFPSATYWLCRSWLALREDRRADAWDDLRRAMAEVSDEFAGPYTAQRIFGPALDLAAALALAEGDVARAVTLVNAATAVLTLGGTVPERPQVRLASEVDQHTAAFPEAAERGRRMSLVEALRYGRVR
jgi:non-specific serine/threonine protein kinase